MVNSTGLQPRGVAEFDEATLIERARAGDRDARARLIERHLDAVYGLALRVLGDRDLAQDAAQDALVNALNGLERFRGEASFRTWLLRITLNAARSVGRRRTRRREVRLVTDEHDDPRLEVPGADVELVRREEAARAMERLQELPPKQRAVVELRINQGLGYAEIGKIVNCSEGAARVNYHLGIKRLREMMQ